MGERIHSARLVLVMFCAALVAVTLAAKPNATTTLRKAVPNAAGGVIKGQVVDENGTPLKGMYVWAADTATRSYINDNYDAGGTAADGTYSVTVPAGSYFINAYDELGNFDNRYVDTWYPNVWDTDFWRNLVAATPVSVPDGGTATADFRIEVGAHLWLTLRDASGAPINVPDYMNPEGTVVHGCWGGMFVEYNGQRFPTNWACLGLKRGDGTYEPYAPPRNRTLFLEGWPQGSNYVPVFYDSKPTLATATPIVPRDATPLPITIVMAATGHSLSGKLSFSAPPTQVRSASAVIYASDGTGLQSLTVGTDLTYKFQGVPDGDYILRVAASVVSNGKTQSYQKYYNNSADFAGATRIAVRGADVGGLDVVMDTPTDAAALKTSAGRISLLASSGATSEPVVISIWTDTGDVNWTAASTQSWLRFSPATGSVSATQGAKSIVVSCDASTLAAGTYNDTLSITGSSGAPLNVPVTLEVTQAAVANQPPVAANVSSFVFIGVASTFAPVTMTITNPGTATAAFNLRSTLLAAFPSSGTLAPGASADVKVTPYITALEFGSITGSLEILTNGQFTRAIPASVNVAPVPTPVVRTASDSVSSLSTTMADVLVSRVVPSVASNLSGVAGSKWSSDVFISNLPSATTSNLTSFFFTPIGSQNGAGSLLVSGAVKLPMLTLSSPVANLFRLDSGYGALDMRPQAAIASWARIFTMKPDGSGSYGQEVPAFDSSTIIGAGETGTIAVLLGDSFRSNLLISEVRGAAVNVAVVVRDGSGTTIRTQDVPVAAFEQKPINNIFAGAGATGYATLTVSGSGGVGVLASLIDNATNDPTTVVTAKAAPRTANGKVIIPGVVHSPGVGNTTWRSDVWLVNTSASPLVFTPYLQPGGGAPAVPGKSHTVAAGAQTTFADVVLNEFGLTSGRGALRLDVTSGDPSAVRVFSRTFNVDNSGGTFGQGIVPAQQDYEVVLGDPGLSLFGIARSRAFRTNLQIQETAGAAVTVQISGEGLNPGIGTTLVSPLTNVNLSGYDLLQIGDILGLLGFPNDVANARVKLKVISGSGAISAYGSIIDVGTGDATTVPAFKLAR